MPLDHLRLLRVGGADRSSFLQGQLTQDLRTITPTRSAPSGWTNAQGRLLLVGQLFAWDDACWLTAPASGAEALARRLRQFVLRARVTVDLAPTPPRGLLAAADAGIDAPDVLPPEPLACRTGAGWCVLRVAGDGARLIVLGEPPALAAGPAMTPADSGAWLLADVRAGLPAIDPANEAAFVPQMVNLDLLGGVHFAKGCYSGQEIINRTRHLGRIKRRMLRFGCEAAATPPPGAAIHGAAGEAGRVVTAAAAPRGCELLAVTQLEALAGPLFADAGRRWPLTQLPLPYAIPELA